MTEHPIKIRPHHGLCLRFFRGKGYSAEFVAHMTGVKAALEENPLVLLTGGTDEICSACPNNMGGCCETEEKVSRYDREVLLRCGLSEGETMPFRVFEAQVLQRILLAGQREQVCGDCQWNALCH